MGGEEKENGGMSTLFYGLGLGLTDRSHSNASQVGYSPLPLTHSLYLLPSLHLPFSLTPLSPS